MSSRQLACFCVCLASLHYTRAATSKRELLQLTGDGNKQAERTRRRRRKPRNSPEAPAAPPVVSGMRAHALTDTEQMAFNNALALRELHEGTRPCKLACRVVACLCSGACWHLRFDTCRHSSCVWPQAMQ